MPTVLLGNRTSTIIPTKHIILIKNSLSCFIFAHPSNLKSFHRMYLALNTRIASHSWKSEIVSSCDNKIVLQHGNINYLVLHFHHFTSITMTATTKTAINSTNDISFRTRFCLKKKSTTNRTARATNSKVPIILFIILSFRCFFTVLKLYCNIYIDLFIFDAFYNNKNDYENENSSTW